MATLSELITTLKGKMLPLEGGTLTGALTAPSVSITNDNAKVNGKNIVRSVNGTVAGTDGNVDLNYLPLSGGTMNGDISFSQSHAHIDGEDLVWVTTDGASIAVCGENYYESMRGAFQLVAKSGQSLCSLDGHPDSTLMWGDKNIVRTVNGVVADAAGNVALKAVITATWISNDGWSWYRKWSDGWIEQGGTNSTSSRTVTFPLAFSSFGYTFISSARLGNTDASAISCAEYWNSRSKTEVAVTCRWGGNENGGINFSWYACGY